MLIPESRRLDDLPEDLRSEAQVVEFTGAAIQAAIDRAWHRLWGQRRSHGRIEVKISPPHDQKQRSHRQMVTRSARQFLWAPRYRFYNALAEP